MHVFMYTYSIFYKFNLHSYDAQRVLDAIKEPFSSIKNRKNFRNIWITLMVNLKGSSDYKERGGSLKNFYQMVLYGTENGYFMASLLSTFFKQWI